MPDASPTTQALALGSVFTLFFVTLGPLKMLGSVAVLTRELEPAAIRALALRAFLVSVVALVGGGFVGVKLLETWHITVPTMVLAGGVVFFLVALEQVMEPYRRAPEPPAPLPEKPMAAAMRLAFPIVITPYGVAALIVLLAQSESSQRLLAVLGILLVVLLFDFLALLYARRVMSGAVTVMVLRILGAVLAILQSGSRAP